MSNNSSEAHNARSSNLVVSRNNFESCDYMCCSVESKDLNDPDICDYCIERCL